VYWWAGIGNAQKRIKRPIGGKRVIYTTRKFTRLDSHPRRDSAGVNRRDDGRGGIATDCQQERDRNPRYRHNSRYWYIYDV
jgi:hypothetical protein